MPFVIAHAGHWLVNVLYLAPLAIFVAVLARQKLKERRGPDAAPSATADAPFASHAERSAEPAQGSPTATKPTARPPE